MKLVITGSRFGRADVEYWLDRWVRKYGVPDLIILGDARGVDAQARAWCIKHGYNHRVFVADWATHGKAAGPLRNQQMMDAADVGDWCIGLPAGEGAGTFDCLRRAKNRGLFIVVPPEKTAA